MSEKTDLRKLLVLQGPALESDGTLDFFRGHFDVQIAQSLDAALDAMRVAPFDAVLAETADFLPLERGIVTQQASVILDTIADGVCIIGPEGELVWANRRLRSYPPALLEMLRRLCREAHAHFSSGGEAIRGKRFSLMPDNNSYYEVICSGVCDHAGKLRQVVAVVVDATAQRRQQLKLNAIDLLIIENVGNLVCPSLFDLGEDHRVVLFSVTEGDDKPLKYPTMFMSADVCIISKTDLLPYVDFDIEVARTNLMQVNHHLKVFELSVKQEESLMPWIGWLKGMKSS